MNLFGMKRKDLEEYFLSIGEKKYKALQVFEWLYKSRVLDIDLMTNVSTSLRSKLKDNFSTKLISIDKVQEDKLVKKYLFKLEDNNYIEAVLMRHDYGNSVCVSSQVGCNMGCSFCESGRLKKVRDLEAHEMVLQILLIEEELKERVSSIVIMGIGEPLDNYDNVMNFIRIVNDDKGIAIGARHITLSTCGIVPKMDMLSNENIQINLAISLHAPNDLLRNELMPINKVYNTEKLMSSIRRYIALTNRRITIEYVMLKGVNDSIVCANQLASLLRGLNVYVNLIPYNETNHLQYKKTLKEDILKFYDCLKKRGINVTIRREFGSNIDAACGQLRSKEVE